MHKEVINHNQARMEAQFVEWTGILSIDSADSIYIAERCRDLFLDKTRFLDIGGGTGLFLEEVIKRSSCSCADLVDPSDIAIANKVADTRINHIHSDFESAKFPTSEYDAIIFRTVLHHMLGSDNSSTTEVQRAALARAKKLLSRRGRIFVVENFYEPYFSDDATGRLIYSVTKNKLIANVARSMGANTAGVGVRFRSFGSWSRIFSDCGLKVVSKSDVPGFGIPFPAVQRAALLCRRRFQATIELAVA